LKKKAELSVIKEDPVNETARGENTLDNLTPGRQIKQNPQDIENEIKAEDEILKEVMKNNESKKEEEELLKHVNKMNSEKSSTLSN
jgi:hypothetical protein